MLYLSDVPFVRLGFRTDLPSTAPGEETEKIMSKLPIVIAGMATLMTGGALLSRRRPAPTLEVAPRDAKAPAKEDR
jgi:hypothetical protein